MTEFTHLGACHVDSYEGRTSRRSDIISVLAPRLK